MIKRVELYVPQLLKGEVSGFELNCCQGQLVRGGLEQRSLLSQKYHHHP